MIPTGIPLLVFAALAWVALTATWVCGWMCGHHAARRHPSVRAHRRRHLRVVDTPSPNHTGPAPFDWEQEDAR